jgi:hypothetical protein
MTKSTVTYSPETGVVLQAANTFVVTVDASFLVTDTDGHALLRIDADGSVHIRVGVSVTGDL